MKHWIFTESHLNWEFDNHEGHNFFGVPNSRLVSAKKISKGDIAFIYVFGRAGKKSAISGLRKVISSELIPIRKIHKYDSVTMDFGIPTKPIISLQEDDWIEIKPLINKLECIKNKKSWGSSFRTCFMGITSNDADFLLKEIKKV